MAFANGDNETCERSLGDADRAGWRDEHMHSPTWLARFDFYRATGNHQAFESLAVDYVAPVRSFGPAVGVPMPRLVVEGRKAADDPPQVRQWPRPKASMRRFNWACPERLDLDAVVLLRKRC